MIIPKAKDLQQEAAQQLEKAAMAQKIILVFSLITLGASALVLVLQLLFDSQISQAGGLSNLNVRSLFSTLSSILPILQYILNMCLGFGLLACAVRISRGQFTSVMTLKAGLDRFWQLLRLTAVQLALLFGIAIACSYLASFLFLLTPFADGMVSMLESIAAGNSILSDSSAQLDLALSASFASNMLPLMAIFCVVLLAVGIPILYKYRMAIYVLYDNPGMGGLQAMRASRLLMRKNRRKLLLVDLSFWWYYLLQVLAVVLGYGDLILSLFGITLPLSADAALVVFTFLEMAVLLAVYYLFRIKREVTMACVYNSLLPSQEKQNQVILGSIFQM